MVQKENENGIENSREKLVIVPEYRLPMVAAAFQQYRYDSSPPQDEGTCE